MLKLLDPRSGPVKGSISRAARLESLGGLRLAILWNGKTFGGDLLQRVAALLTQKYRAEVAIFLRKPFLGNEAPPDYFDQIATSGSQLALVGFGD